MNIRIKDLPWGLRQRALMLAKDAAILSGVPTETDTLINYTVLAAFDWDTSEEGLLFWSRLNKDISLYDGRYEKIKIKQL